jgi:Domain of unknown function (DUF4157)
MFTTARTIARVATSGPNHRGVPPHAANLTPPATIVPAVLPRFLQSQRAESGLGDVSKAARETATSVRSLPRYLQAKLEISQPGDVHEQEADRVAEQVMRMPDHTMPQPCAAFAGVEPGATYASETGSKVQRKVDVPANTPAASDAASMLAQTGAGQSLDHHTRDYFEPRFGRDFGNVRVHVGTAAEQTARDVNAHAFTVGRDVVFGAGRFAPATQEGRTLLAHELAHVVQQSVAVPVRESQDDKAGGGSFPVAITQESGAWNRVARQDADEPEYRMPVPVMHAQAEREFDNADYIAKVRYLLDAPNSEAGLSSVYRVLDKLTDAQLQETVAALSASHRKKLLDNMALAGDLKVDRIKDALTMSTTTFSTRKYKLSDTKVTVVKADAAKGVKEIQESPAYYAGEILKKSGIDPDAWFSSFTSISFLGRSVADIHTDLAGHLKGVEKKLVEAHGGDQKDPAVAGKNLGLNEDIGGARHAPTGTAFSMHLFGLAIDVNYTSNPWVGVNPAFERAGQLVQGSIMQFKSGMSYDDLSSLDKTMETYFSYLDDADTLGKQLAANSSGTANFWKGKSVEAAQKQIQQDLDFCAAKWERTGAKDVIKKGGFLSLPKSLVDGMGLDWGASYGDVMHFDMRNKGNGRKIQASIGVYKAEKKAESEKKD